MTFPFGIKNLDELYKNSESGNGGFFPLGKGVLWHSGIHINSETAEEFSPLLNGKVVMYRLSKDYKTVDLPEVISKNKFGENESYYGDFYKRSDNNEDEYTLKETQSKEYVSDCFVMLKHELHIDALKPSTFIFYMLYMNLTHSTALVQPSTFIFYTLYMNLEPALKSGLYEDTNFQVDGKIHVLSDEDCFSTSTIGKPGLDKGHRYFDYVLILEKDLYSYSSDKSKPKDLFHGINSNVILYDRKKAKQIDMLQAETLFIPVHAQYAVEECSKDGKNFAKLVSLKSFRIYLKTNGGLQGECFKSENKYVLKDSSKIWFSNGQSIDFNNDSSSLSGKEKYLYDLIKNDLQLLKGKNVTVVKVLDSGQPAINIVLSKEKKFWVLDDSEFFAQNGGTIERDCEIKAYSENPCMYEYAAIETTDELRKTILDIENDEYTDCNGNIYYKAKSRTSSFFVTEKDKNGCFKNCFDWNEWFFKYEPSDENSIRSENTSLTKQLIEWYEIKRKKYGWPTIELSHWWGLRPHLKWKSLKLLYDGKKDVQAAEQMLIEYRKCICKHPIEWDASVIEKLYDAKQDKKTDLKTIRTEHIDYLKSVAKVTDIWKGGLSEAFKTKSLFFANPLYFISHLEKCGVFEFNPYAGKKYKDVYGYEGDAPGINMDTVITGNPGFAPVWAARSDRNPNINGYACVTGFFNQDYYNVHNELYTEGTKKGKRVYEFYYHEGLDFRGSEGTSVVSLINGKILRFGHTSSMGGFVLMQSKEKSTRYYLAVHLQESFENLSFDIDVTPGTVVGHIGPYPNGAHLHVSVIELSNGEAYENNRIPKDGSGAVYAPESNSNTYRFPTFDYKNRAKMKNPFNYEEPWVGRKKN